MITAALINSSCWTMLAVRADARGVDPGAIAARPPIQDLVIIAR
jgi:hypothetical protein